MLNNSVAGLGTVIVPLLAMLFSGAGFVLAPSGGSVWQAGARAVVASISILTLTATGLVYAGLPVELAWGLMLGINGAWFARAWYAGWRLPARHMVHLLTGVVILYAVFAGASLWRHDGLPTGDSQKAIFWGQSILVTNELPAYDQSIPLLNRDPVDFYTPGLHALTAAIMGIVSEPLIAVGLTAVVASLGVALIAAAIAEVVWLPRPSPMSMVVVTLFVLTNLRLLRYIREPGYHFQNVIGEVLLFGSLWLLLRLVQRWQWLDFILAVAALGALAISHQFSAFIGVFILLPSAGLLLYRLARLARHRRHPAYLGLAITALLGLAAFAWQLDLHHKIPHLFTTTPHLLGLVPALGAYPGLLGAFWLGAGIAGLGVLGRQAWSVRRTRPEVLIFIAGTAALLALSQGPRWGVDIPPVRALFYAVVPLSISAAYLVRTLIERVWQGSGWHRWVVTAGIVLVIASAVAGSLGRAYHLDGTVRTNSTLSAPMHWLAHFISDHAENGGAVLIDDYNRRTATWLLLSGQPMYARLGAEIATAMDEAAQTSLRRELYLNQLTYEKVFALSSRPEISALLDRHNIDWIASVEGHSASGFAANPALAEVARADGMVLWRTQPVASPRLTPAAEWLMAPTTLANDIGDEEDTFEHLMASVRAVRLSGPQFRADVTSRVTTAPLIPLRFNVGDYTAALWAADAAAPYRLLVRLANPAPAGLALATPTGARAEVTGLEVELTLAVTDLTPDERGFVTVYLDNPRQLPVHLDLIALGPVADSY